MIVRDNLHKIVDALPEDRLTDLRDNLDDLQDGETSMADKNAAIEEGLDDIRNGRATTLAEYRRTRGVYETRLSNRAA
jgi:hypothetical protein